MKKQERSKTKKENKENKNRSSVVSRTTKHRNDKEIEITTNIKTLNENDKTQRIIIISIIAVFAFISFLVATSTSFSSDEDYLILHFAQHKNLHFVEKTDLSTNILFIEPLISIIYMLGKNMVEYKIIHIAIFFTFLVYLIKKIYDKKLLKRKQIIIFLLLLVLSPIFSFSFGHIKSMLLFIIYSIIFVEIIEYILNEDINCLYNSLIIWFVAILISVPVSFFVLLDLIITLSLVNFLSIKRKIKKAMWEYIGIVTFLMMWESLITVKYTIALLPYIIIFNQHITSFTNTAIIEGIIIVILFVLLHIHEFITRKEVDENVERRRYIEIFLGILTIAIGLTNILFISSLNLIFFFLFAIYFAFESRLISSSEMSSETGVQYGIIMLIMLLLVINSRSILISESNTQYTTINDCQNIAKILSNAQGKVLLLSHENTIRYFINQYNQNPKIHEVISFNNLFIPKKTNEAIIRYLTSKKIDQLSLINLCKEEHIKYISTDENLLSFKELYKGRMINLYEYNAKNESQ